MTEVYYIEQEDTVVLVDQLDELYSLMTYDGIAWHFIGTPVSDWQEITYIGAL